MKRPLQRAETTARQQRCHRGNRTVDLQHAVCTGHITTFTQEAAGLHTVLQQHPSEPHLSPPPASDSDSARVQDWTRVPT